MNEDALNASKGCECQLTKAISELSDSPIQYDDLTHTYCLNAGGGQLRLHFCMFCGGELPQEDYCDRPVPNPTEEDEVTSIMSSVHSWGDMLRVLGEPDEFDLFSNHSRNRSKIDSILDSLHERFPKHWDADPKGPWSQFARYFNRWPSLNLDIYSYPDGSIEYRIWGRSPHDYKPPKRRNWFGKLLPTYTNQT